MDTDLKDLTKKLCNVTYLRCNEKHIQQKLMPSILGDTYVKGKVSKEQG